MAENYNTQYQCPICDNWHDSERAADNCCPVSHMEERYQCEVCGYTSTDNGEIEECCVTLTEQDD